MPITVAGNGGVRYRRVNTARNGGRLCATRKARRLSSWLRSGSSANSRGRRVLYKHSYCSSWHNENAVSASSRAELGDAGILCVICHRSDQWHPQGSAGVRTGGKGRYLVTAHRCASSAQMRERHVSVTRAFDNAGARLVVDKYTERPVP